MIKIEKTDVYGWEAAIRGMRNPMNSWEKSDSFMELVLRKGHEHGHIDPIVGPADHDLMMRLAKAGTSHSKYRRFITVTVDITAPLYWWKEADTYKVGTVANSCSTMHKIHAKEFVPEDFACEYLRDEAFDCLLDTIDTLNGYRKRFLESKDKGDWYTMIQLLPSSYLQRRTMLLNYEVLAHMYHDRKNHKLWEWREFCEWIKTLPYSELITLEEPYVG